MDSAATTVWIVPDRYDGGGKHHDAEDVTEWEHLNGQLSKIAKGKGWSKSEVARRIGINKSTFSEWQAGKYGGRLGEKNTQIRNWLDSLEEMQGLEAAIPVSPGFVMTPSAGEIITYLAYAQAAAGFVFITLGAGMGKTIACRHYCEKRPNSFMATMSPNTRSVSGMLVELAAQLDIVEYNPARLWQVIRDRLARIEGGTLLVVDEAQNLTDEAVDQLRHLKDVPTRCGVALVGNTEIYGRFHKKRGNDGPSYAQIRRRMSIRLKRDSPAAGDIEALIDAWAIGDPGCRRELTRIGGKPGALGQIDETLKIANMLAAGSGRPVDAALIVRDTGAPSVRLRAPGSGYTGRPR